MTERENVDQEDLANERAYRTGFAAGFMAAVQSLRSGRRSTRLELFYWSRIVGWRDGDCAVQEEPPQLERGRI